MSLILRISPGRPFLSTPSARRATPRLQGLRLHYRISIHALREEGDVQRFQRHDQRRVISIHALREEGDPSQGHGQR